jgi:hypothetical protein
MSRFLLPLLLGLGLSAGCLPALDSIEIDQDGDESPYPEDCDDHDAEVSPGAEELCDGKDNDCDDSTWGELEGVRVEGIDNDGDGVDGCDDCDDTDPDNFPGNTEECDDQDNDCDPLTVPVDEITEEDGDGVSACTDCDDDDPANFPGNTEVCDGQDNDCDDSTVVTGEDTDADTDGSIACLDCDDADSANFPDNPEICDGQDNDCEGTANFVDGDSQTENNDNDSDGSVDCLDCEDDDASNFPGNTEVCDGVDNDCDITTVFTDEATDVDNDGVITCIDCDDTDVNNFQGNTELCDGQDNDCFGGDDMGLPGTSGQETDDDSDGETECQGDCNDASATVNSSGTEVCDTLDNDCSGAADEAFDFDNDGAFEWFDCDLAGYPDSLLDCDDEDAAINPSASDVNCDGLDNDCDDFIDDEQTCEAEMAAANLTCIFDENSAFLAPNNADFDYGSFLFCETPRAHQTAFNDCDAIGYHLVVLDQVGDTPWVGNGPGSPTSWWTAGADPQGTANYEWEPGFPIGGQGPWATGSAPTTPSLCISLERATGGNPPENWEVTDCSTQKAFVCEAVFDY